MNIGIFDVKIHNHLETISNLSKIISFGGSYYYTILKRILNIGVDAEQLSKHEAKLRKLFNGLTFFGFLTAIIQFVTVIQQDIWAALFHTIWGIYCMFALLLHYFGWYKVARFSSVLIVLVFGTLAAARIGSDYYPHVASFGIMVATFVFFDIRKEWGYILFFVLLHASGIMLVESDILMNKSISFQNPEFIRTSTVIGTALFVALEVVTILRLSWLAEKEMIDELQESNHELKQVNEEKTIMLQEIHHRVKNNLQMVISMIRLQTKKIDDERTVETFDELRMRLISIARMHEMMYLSKKLNKINFKNYVEELCEMITDSSCSKNKYKLNVETDVDHLSAEGIVPLALILNELITNSIKHAFQGENSKDPRISISFLRCKDKRYELIYTDNGTWKEIPEKSEGFGLELIELLTDQLDGEIKRETLPEGTRYSFKLTV